MQVVLLPGFVAHPAKPFFDVQLGYQDFGVFCSFGKGMDDSVEGMAKLVKGSSWHHFYSTVVD
jgi:hypothetical protein